MDSPLSNARSYYTTITGLLDRNVCTYCGGIAVERDHLIAVLDVPRGMRRYIPWVPSCRACNSGCRKCPAYDIPGRRACILACSRRKYDDSQLYYLRRGGWITVKERSHD